MRYIVISEEFAVRNKDYTKDNLVFAFAKTTDGRFVCSENSINEFPELFADMIEDIQVVELTRKDFITT